MQKKRRLKRSVIAACLLLFLLVLVWRYLAYRTRQEPLEPQAPDTPHVVLPSPSPGEPDSLMEDTTDAAVKDTVLKPQIPEAPAPRQTDTIPVVTDTVDAVPADSTVRPETPCDRDSVPPWVYPDPSGGMHYGPVSVVLVTNEPAVMRWRFEDNPAWTPYDGRAIEITSSATLVYEGVDSCQNYAQTRKEYYEIQPFPRSKYCPDDMAHVKVGETSFCIDRFEWPNQLNVRPTAFVSLYHAIDSCFSVGKRLCKKDEWIIACSGPQSTRYPYGGVYEKNACVSRDTSAHKSGTYRECRGYFDVYDMSGNLAEWTNTRSTQNPSRYEVMGGFWKTGSESSCFHSRYSYFPQNRHNPVGFRCCKDSNIPSPDTKSKRP
ncbi:MAG: SUMF1/EgtB/PvdO family nonheme iron enzyme [Chitinivibrionales bacterium]|nr:SUMF1/EgtB/PvdO family nonheme iron enzyme [Chitinivibrionales bacterium]